MAKNKSKSKVEATKELETSTVNVVEQAPVLEKTEEPKRLRKIWTRDSREVVFVEKTRTSVLFKDEKGKLKGGREVYGVAVNQD